MYRLHVVIPSHKFVKKKKLLPFVALQSLWYVGRVNVCDRTAEFMYIYVTCGSTY